MDSYPFQLIGCVDKILILYRFVGLLHCIVKLSHKEDTTASETFKYVYYGCLEHHCFSAYPFLRARLLFNVWQHKYFQFLSEKKNEGRTFMLSSLHLKKYLFFLDELGILLFEVIEKLIFNKQLGV